MIGKTVKLVLTHGRMNRAVKERLGYEGVVVSIGGGPNRDEWLIEFSPHPSDFSITRRWWIREKYLQVID